MNFNKETGCDLILQKLEKIGPGQFGDPLSCIINSAINSIAFPNKAKEVFVTSVNKGGNAIKLSIFDQITICPNSFS